MLSLPAANDFIKTQPVCSSLSVYRATANSRFLRFKIPHHENRVEILGPWMTAPSHPILCQIDCKCYSCKMCEVLARKRSFFSLLVDQEFRPYIHDGVPWNVKIGNSRSLDRLTQQSKLAETLPTCCPCQRLLICKVASKLNKWLKLYETLDFA